MLFYISFGIFNKAKIKLVNVLLAFSFRYYIVTSTLLNVLKNKIFLKRPELKRLIALERYETLEFRKLFVPWGTVTL